MAKDKVIGFRATEDQVKYLQMKAEERDMKLSEYLRFVALKDFRKSSS